MFDFLSWKYCSISSLRMQNLYNSAHSQMDRQDHWTRQGNWNEISGTIFLRAVDGPCFCGCNTKEPVLHSEATLLSTCRTDLHRQTIHRKWHTRLHFLQTIHSISPVHFHFPILSPAGDR